MATPAWQKMPEDLCGQRERMHQYFQALLALAQFFSASLGHAELLRLLMGSQQSNPLLRWRDQIEEATSLMAESRYPEAIGALSDMLIDARGLRGSGVDRLLPITYGYLGESYFQSGRVEKAVAPFQQALRLCEEQKDVEGVAAYLGNLYEVQRYLGQGELAASFAERLAGVYKAQGKGKEADRFQGQAARVRSGESLNRVVAVVEGHRYELTEVPAIKDGRLQFEFERNRVTLRPATSLSQRGEELAKAGKYDEALIAFRSAVKADPFDPHCRYLEGLTLLHLERCLEAIESYRAVEELAPGWFNCRADLWLAEQMSMGKIEQEMFLVLMALEDGPEPPAGKVRLAEQSLGRTPDLAPLHLFHGKSLARLGRLPEAAAAFHKGLASGDDPDTNTRLLLELGMVVDSAGEKTRLLQEACRLNGNLIAAATAAVVLRVG